VGLLFVATLYGVIQLREEETLQMMFNTYITLGIFLLLAARNPLANRAVIAFAVWANIAHAAVMAAMAVHLPNEREDLLIAAAVFGVIGLGLIVLSPARQPIERVSVVVV
jgi:hypothetical protein